MKIRSNRNRFRAIALMGFFSAQEEGIAAKPETPKTPNSVHSTVYSIDPNQSIAKVHAGYTLGTYHIPNPKLTGTLELSPDQTPLKVVVTASIDGFKSNDSTLDCHLRESLGLDYQISDYPDRHVCVHDRLPETGKNAPVFKEVRFDLDPSTPVKWIELSTIKSIKGKWRIHGIEKASEPGVRISKLPDGFRVEGSDQFKLSDFGITVKKFLFISVQDPIEVEWSLVFHQEQ